jgi:hypothetical protein
MPVPSTISELSTSAGSNSPGSGEAVTTVDDYVRALAAFIAQLRDRDSAFALTLLDDADAAAARTTLVVPSRTGADASGTWGISITGNAATATTATNASRSVTGAGLATGGGALTADRTITVTAASQAQAEAGTDTATVMTPQRTAQALTAQLPAANAALAAGSVGTYAFCQQVTGTAVIGDTVAGSNLRYADRAGGTNSVTIPSGTWRCMGHNSINDRGTVWLRIA